LAAAEILAWHLGSGETAVLSFALAQAGWTAILDTAALACWKRRWPWRELSIPYIATGSFRKAHQLWSVSRPCHPGLASIGGGRATSSDARKTARAGGQNRAKSGLVSHVEGRFCEHRAGLEGCGDARKRNQW